MERIVGVIPAAGKGIRAYPSTKYVPKVMLEVGGKPLIQRNIELMRDKLGIKRVYVVVAYLGDMIKNHLKNGSELGVDITYLQNDRVDEGLIRSIQVAKEHVKLPFIVILGDELYVNTNHGQILSMLKQDFNAICAIKKTDNRALIKKNYSVSLRKGKIVSLTEKPQQIENRNLGCGTYVLKPSFFDYIEKTPRSSVSKKVELTDVINTIATQAGRVLPFFLRGDYVNVNTVYDLNMANYVFRNAIFKKCEVSVIIPALNEEKTITCVVKDFKRQKVDEVIVLPGNSTDDTVKQAEKAGAKIVTSLGHGQTPGYGEKLKRGMEVAKGDILILTEADGTFRAKDLGKILEYLKDADMVVGTRTTKQMIEQGANMDWFLRWGNIFLGKVMQLLWLRDEPRFTDVGCTYRGLWKDTFLKIKDNLKATGPEFSPEMMVEVLRAKRRVLEIPVSYFQRVSGESKHSGTYRRKMKTGLRMLFLMFKRRLR
ncbi:MAG: glycosyltransferase [Desulfobacterales bacterium]|nr:glycosyltransferase [Desulfobacterales bacterium]